MEETVREAFREETTGTEEAVREVSREKIETAVRAEEARDVRIPEETEVPEHPLILLFRLSLRAIAPIKMPIKTSVLIRGTKTMR